MTPERHRQLAERITRSAARCRPQDWEMKIEAAMLAGTHWANYALHRCNLTTEGEDIVHTSMLVVNQLRKYSLAEPEILSSLEQIEELRPLYVRGDADGGAEAGDTALELLSRISTLAVAAGHPETGSPRRDRADDARRSLTPASPAR